jgi:high-affinity Fe2+/Pb2+ permease
VIIICLFLKEVLFCTFFHVTHVVLVVLVVLVFAVCTYAMLCIFCLVNSVCCFFVSSFVSLFVCWYLFVYSLFITAEKVNCYPKNSMASKKMLSLKKAI